MNEDTKAAKSSGEATRPGKWWSTEPLSPKQERMEIMVGYMQSAQAMEREERTQSPLIRPDFSLWSLLFFFLLTIAIICLVEWLTNQ